MPNPKWCDAIFGAKAIGKGGVIRRAVPDVEREIGRAAFEREVRNRGFHLVEVGSQFIVLCNTGAIKLIC